MSIEKNIHDIKDTLTKDQNLIVKAFKLEAFYKKYKKIIFIIIILLVIFSVYQGLISYREYSANVQTNELMNTLYNKNATEEEKKHAESMLATIKPELYDFYRYTQLQSLSSLQLKNDENLAILEQLGKSSNELIATLARYQYASLSENVELLENFKSDSMPILRDRARFLAAYLHLQNNNTQKAHEILESIQPDVDNRVVAQMASLLKHYGVVSKDTKKLKEESSETRNKGM